MKPATLPQERSAAHVPALADDVRAGRWQSTWSLSMLGSLLMFVALPPLAWWPLAWVAPVPWLLLILRPRLPGRRPYLVLWVAGFAFWLSALHWLRLPHWATGIGWVALSFYLAFYLPLFVWLARVAVHQLGTSLLLAAPIIWTALELLKAHFLTGFTMGSLGHTQYRWPEIIQISALAGGYTVSCLIVLVAACLAKTIYRDEAARAWWPLLIAPLAMLAAWGYGHFALSQQAASAEQPSLRVALIQGSYDTQFDLPPERNPQREVHELYGRLTRAALRDEPDIDLVVWPETMFGYTQGLLDESQAAGADVAEVKRLRERCRQTQEGLAEVHRQLNLGRRQPWNWIVGVDTWQHRYIGGEMLIERYNSAQLVDAAGAIQQRYDKMHPVVFGEYVPWGKTFPWLYHLTPMAGGIENGAGPKSFAVGPLRFSPNICYETVIPHLIRRQVVELRRRGEEPDVLVNLTNDGWFWGSSELDLHLACGVFRAVECRKPLVIAANTGFSAHIDGNGRILQQGPRHAEGHLIAQVQRDGRDSLYLRIGDWPAGICLLLTAGVAVFGIRSRMAPAMQA
ncbi:MAG: apolipoprotein N-acyltransferase [Pirellulales bacterium]